MHYSSECSVLSSKESAITYKVNIMHSMCIRVCTHAWTKTAMYAMEDVIFWCDTQNTASPWSLKIADYAALQTL